MKRFNSNFFIVVFVLGSALMGVGCSSSKDSAGQGNAQVSGSASNSDNSQSGRSASDAITSPAANANETQLADRNAPEERDQLTSSLRGPRDLDQRDIANVSRQSVSQSLEQLGMMLKHGVFSCEEFHEKLNSANRHCVAGENHRVLSESLLTKCHNLQKSYNSYMMFCY